MRERARGSLACPQRSLRTNAPDTTASSKAKQRPLSPLSRPLGVPEPPLMRPMNQSEKIRDLLDREKHIEKRKMLVKEVTRGYFHDINAMKFNEGKLWTAPNTLIREDKALYFPTIYGKNLLREKVTTTGLAHSRITLLRIIGTQISAEQTASFVDPIVKNHFDMDHSETFEDPNHLNMITVNLQPNHLKALLVKVFSHSLRTTIPRPFQSKYVLSSDAVEYLRAPLGIDNGAIGYVYLLDRNCKIRWAACGAAQPSEAIALEKCLTVLLERERSQQPSPAPV